MPKVLVVGDVMTDVVVRPEGPIAVGADTRAAIRVLPGGAGANQACWLAREGVQTRFVARVGAADRAAREDALRRVRGRRAAWRRRDCCRPEHSSRCCRRRRAELSDRPRRQFEPLRADLPDALLDGVDLLHVSGYALFEAGPREAVLKSSRRRRGGKSPSPSIRPPIPFSPEVGPDTVHRMDARRAVPLSERGRGGHADRRQRA